MAKAATAVKAGKAVLVKDGLLKGNARLYRVTPSVKYPSWVLGGKKQRQTRFVIVSAVNAMFSGPETYIFPADRKGEILDWGGLPGSFRGAFDHEKALREAGYEVDHG